MTDKFNAFSKAQKEIKKTKVNEATDQTTSIRPRGETKQQMSIMLTPTHKKEIRSLANSYGVSVSELIAHWIDVNKKN